MSKQTNLAAHLKALREAHQYSQQFVADYLHIIRQTYSHYETGRIKPPEKNLYALAKLYDIHPNALVDDNFATSDKQCLTGQEEYLLYHFRRLDERDKKDIILFAEIKSGERTE